jgi:two-component system phosphate regulon response regulator PhoB
MGIQWNTSTSPQRKPATSNVNARNLVMRPKRSVLVVEDEKAISDLVAFHLEATGYEAIAAADAERAMELLNKRLPDLVLLDIMLPDGDGIEILQHIRNRADAQTLPVILLTARAEEDDRILGLETGADDYVTKPFSPRELMLRIDRLVTTREQATQQKIPTTFGILSIDEDRFRVTVSGKPVEVSATEMRLLGVLIRFRGMVLSRAQLLQDAWGYMPNVTERTVDTHVKRLRQKLGAASEYLETVRGIGYRWIDAPPPSDGPVIINESNT